MTNRDPTDSAMYSATPEKMSDPLVRPSAARAELVRLGIDATNVATLFAWMIPRHLIFRASGPERFHVQIDRMVMEDGKVMRGEQISTADGLTFGNALVVAIYVAVKAHPELLTAPAE